MITPLPGIVSTKPGSATRPFPGITAEVVDESEGKPVDKGQGLLIIKRPWPSMLRTLYKEDDRFVETYFSKFGKETYLVGDAARKDKDGYFWIIGRIDDVVNVSGHRLSTAEVESAIVSHQKVAEAAVIGQSDEDTGQAICAFVTLQGDTRGNRRAGRRDPRPRRRPDRQVRPAQADHLGRRPAEDPLGQDHAPAAARHRRGPCARRRHDAARPRRDVSARGQDQGASRPEAEPTGETPAVQTAQSPAELVDLPAPRDWDRLAVARSELGGAAELRAQLDRAVQVGHVLAVHAHEPVTAPSAARSR